MKSTALENFSRWIRETIVDPSAGECLPTIHELARRFNVSNSSIQRALKPFLEDGSLTGIRGRGIFVTSRMESPAQPVSNRTIPSARSIADAVTDDIATGRLKHGDPLPPVKLVRRQFKTAQKNVTRAYRILEQKGLARRVGKRYRVGGMQSLRSFGARGTIVCFNFADGNASDVTSNVHIRLAFETMEHELHNHRLALEFLDAKRLDLFLRPENLAKSTCAGIIISGIDERRFDVLFPRLDRLGPALARSGKRILLCGAHYRRPKRTQFFCHGTIVTSVVRTAADTCFTKGFRDIVLLFQETDTTITDLRYFVRFVSESLMRNPRVRIRFLIQPLGESQTPERIFERTNTFREYKDHRYLQGLLSKYAPMTMDELFQMVTTGDTIEELLHDTPPGSLLVTTRPSTARAAVAWCTSHRIPLPSGAAVLCFNIDKASDFTFQGIATCSPDWPTIGYIMAHSLIGDIPIKKSRKGFLPTPAVLYERGTMP